MSAVIRLPNGWDPRPYQLPAWSALERGVKRALLLWHRRAGKDDLAMHWAMVGAMQRVGNYWHMLPKTNQARKALWDAVNPHTGKRRIDEAFPQELRQVTRENEMMIRFRNGSTWQVVGSDNFNALVGAPPIGLVMSEFAIADPAAWDYLSPILRENKGWAIFPYTPRGKNHGYMLYRQNERNAPDWFVQKLTIDDTRVFTAADIDAERREGKSEDFLAQEYWCSFDAANPGAYYAKQIAQAWKDGRIGRVPVEPGVDCDTWWDLGIDDSMSIWITQTVVREIRCVHYYEQTGEGLAHYAKYLKEWADKHEIRFARHGMPHDIEVRELGTGKSRREVATRLGLRPIVVAPKIDREDGIEQVRRILSQCWIDEQECARGISALTEYAKEWDEKNKVFAQRPRHDWASHGADAFRTMATIHTGRAPGSVQHRTGVAYRGGGWMAA